VVLYILDKAFVSQQCGTHYFPIHRVHFEHQFLSISIQFCCHHKGEHESTLTCHFNDIGLSQNRASKRIFKTIFTTHEWLDVEVKKLNHKFKMYFIDTTCRVTTQIFDIVMLDEFYLPPNHIVLGLFLQKY
jgi:hypothetical protein